MTKLKGLACLTLMTCMLQAASTDEPIYLESNEPGFDAFLINEGDAYSALALFQEIWLDKELVADAPIIIPMDLASDEGIAIRLDNLNTDHLSDGIYDVRLHLSGEGKDGRFYRAYHTTLIVEEGNARIDSLLEPLAAPDPLTSEAFTDLDLDMDDSANKRAVDPGTYTSYGCYWYANYNYNYPNDGLGAILGRVYWPLSNCVAAGAPPSNRRLVIFSHGAGLEYYQYHYLMRHLALNGFVAATIDNYVSNSIENMAEYMVSYVNSLYTYWPHRSKLRDEIVWAGHSRGGEAAAIAAYALENYPNEFARDFETKGVISIAPTDGGPTASGTRYSLTGAMTPAYMGLYESKDGDVNGYAINPNQSAPDKTVFAMYDRAGSEYSSEGLVIAGLHMRKVLGYLIKGNHKGWLDDNYCFALAGNASCDDHQSMARAWFNAFLRWNVYGDSSMRNYLNGTSEPASMNGVEYTLQFSDNPRRVLDNFEDSTWNTNNLGGSVYKSSGIVVMGNDDLLDLDAAAPHDTRGMRIKWSTSYGTPYMRWYIPNTAGTFTGRYRDVTDFTHLSLRAGQNYNDAWNDAGEVRDFYLRIYSASGWSSYVKATDYGKMIYPHEYKQFVNGSYYDYSNSNMETIRVPLTAFGNVDKENVYYVYLYFTVPGSEAGSIHIDSLEFAK